MKTKRVLFLLPFLLTFSFSSALFSVNIRNGQKGEEVTKLQKFLVQKGILNTSNFGNFGPLTLKAVKAYQSNNNLPSTGFVGPSTRDKMNKELLNDTSSSTVMKATLQDSILIDNLNPKVGDIVNVELKVVGSSSSPVYTVGVTLNFDPKKISYIDSTMDKNIMPLSQEGYWTTDSVNGIVVRTGGFSGGLTNTQTFAKYKFKVIDKGTTKISITKGLALDANNNDNGIETKYLEINIK